MKITKLKEELEGKEFFQKFIQENKDAYLGACFTVIGDEEKCQLDYFIPSKEKMATIAYPFSEVKIHEDKIKQCKRLDLENLKIDIKDVWDKVEELKKENKVNNKTSKIIAILKDDIWNITALATSMDMIRIKIDALNCKVSEFKKSSMFEFIKMAD